MPHDPLGLFWAKVDRSGDGCWEWTASRDGSGYGRHGSRAAHRYIFARTIGPIPQGMQVCHRCDNPPCVRPDHLFLGTPAENMADMVAKGRARGPKAPTEPSRGRMREQRPGYWEVSCWFRYEPHSRGVKGTKEDAVRRLEELRAELLPSHVSLG